MLPAHIIHEILERERERERPGASEIFIELPVDDNRSDIPSREDRKDEDRGVAVIDFVI